MRFLLMFLLLFIGCDDDPVSPELEGCTDELLYGTWTMETYNWCGDGISSADSGEYFVYDGTNYQQISGGEIDEEGTYTCSDNQLDWCASNGDCSNSTYEIIDSNYLTITIDVDSACVDIILTFIKDDGSCAYEYDCAGNCGGSAFINDCGVCAYVNVNELGYHCGDIQVLQDMIDANPSLDGQSPLDINNTLSWAGALPDSWDENGRLIYVFLNDKQLTSLPESIGNLSSLESLYLYNNQLTTIPESIGELSNLYILSLYENQLISLPESIGALSNLRILSLNENQLTNLPESFGQLSNLESLDLELNQLTSLPESFGQLSSLESLDLKYNQLTILPESFGELSNLKHLYLYENQLTSLPESFGQLSNLEILNLELNQLTSLPESICNLPSSCWINVENNQLCEEYHYDCIDDIEWGTQDQSNCCEGTNNSGELDPNWTTCP